MTQYIGTKQVMAEPMNEEAAVEKGFARKNTDNHEWRNGYHVQYANPDGSIYESWSPRQVFEQSYRKSETFLDRMRIEADDLGERVDKLEKFLHSSKVLSVDPEERQLLSLQAKHMSDYYLILIKRIALHENIKNYVLRDTSES